MFLLFLLRGCGFVPDPPPETRLTSGRILIIIEYHNCNRKDGSKSIAAGINSSGGIGSVSSSIVPERLAAGIERYGDRIVVTHPFHPAHIVPYFELCQSTQTAPGVMRYMAVFLESMGRKPVCLKKPTPGFIGNRLQFALWRECLALVEEGICEPRDIDRALNYSFCPRYTSIGIFENFDAGGMELNRAVCRNLFPILSDRKDVPPVIESMIAEGKYGMRSGEGFYDWRGVDMEQYEDRVNEPYLRFCRWDFPETPCD